MRTAIRGAACGIGAAVLFGLSTPIAKLLLAEVPPLMLASLLYLGAAAGLVAAAPFAPQRERHETPLRRGDIPLLLGIVVTGGIVGPLLMLLGLQRVSGVAGSLLLNLEAPFTILIAVLVFREHLTRRDCLAAVLIIAGAAILAYEPGELRAEAVGALAIAGACLSWGFDNNWTQRLALRDPFAVVRVKALGAGSCTLVIGLLFGQRIPPPRFLAGALIVGVFSYGVSILLDAYALRLLGAAREAAFFATAPFVGALAAVPLLGDRIGAPEAVAFLAMSVGVAILLKLKHEHLHTHEPLEHEHVHVHDEHHQHAHLATDPPGEPHSHPHRHEPAPHSHPHVSDLHHRHEHPEKLKTPRTVIDSAAIPRLRERSNPAPQSRLRRLLPL